MNKLNRITLFVSYLAITLIVFVLITFFILQKTFIDIILDWSFYVFIALFALTTQEMFKWVNIGKRGEWSDLVIILFMGFYIFFFTKDIITSFMGAFSIYLWFGAYELKEYAVINRLVIISLITYNVIFVCGVISFYLDNPFYLNTAFAFSFWILLILGFIFFGRRYLIVWRFMSPAYLTLFLYIIAWIAVIFVNQYTPINFLEYIYIVLIFVNILIYFSSGFLLDKLLGVKRSKNEKLTSLVNEVKTKLDLNSKVRVGFGEYPILNAMAYGPFFDRRIAIIAEDVDEIPEDELKGIVAHELAHTKANHTLILTLITISDLVLRMILKIPATYYDYTFGDPKLPLIYFILFNVSLYIFIYIIVRTLEGNADLYAKKCGYAKELVKALYNLESFYASGREIGLNTMLLCEEKIFENNKKLDYISTAEYLNKSMIKPSRGSLIANLLNSHPPSFLRIASLLGNNLKPFKQALLPFMLLKRSKQKKYAQLFKNERDLFQTIAIQKFNERFPNLIVSEFLKNLKKKLMFENALQKTYLFTNLITADKIIGVLTDVKFKDNIADGVEYVVEISGNNSQMLLETSLFKKEEVDLKETYYIKNNYPLKLENIDIINQGKDAKYIFTDSGQKKIEKEITKTKLPNSTKFLMNLKNKTVFLKIKAQLDIFKCVDVIPAKEFNDYIIIIESVGLKVVKKEIHLKDLIVKPNDIYFSLSKYEQFRKSEITLFNWVKQHRILTTIFLKKPVNNFEICYVNRINVQDKKPAEKNNENIEISNIFGQIKDIPYHQIESVSFSLNSAILYLKSELSFFNVMMYKLLKKLNPKSYLFFFF